MPSMVWASIVTLPLPAGTSMTIPAKMLCKHLKVLGAFEGHDECLTDVVLHVARYIVVEKFVMPRFFTTRVFLRNFTHCSPPICGLQGLMDVWAKGIVSAYCPTSQRRHCSLSGQLSIYQTAYSGDTRSPIPVISVHSFGNLQYRRQS